MPTGKKKDMSQGTHVPQDFRLPHVSVVRRRQCTKGGFLSRTGAPARRALERAGITAALELSAYTETQILQLHGMGPSTVPKLKKALQEAGLSFKESAGVP
jgi:hypothetical protein